MVASCLSPRPDIGNAHIALVVARLVAELLRNAERAIERITDRAAKRRTGLCVGSNGYGRITHQLLDIGDDIFPDLVDILSDALLPPDSWTTSLPMRGERARPSHHILI